MAQIDLTIQCFGTFRQFGDALKLSVPAGSAVAAVKQALILQLGEDHTALVNDSVMSDDETILQNDSLLQQDANLAILPPVCGG